MDEIKRILKHKEDSYKVLNVSEESSKEEIRKSYKKLAVKIHPDRNSHPNASEAFIVLQNAYEDLTEGKPKYTQAHEYRRGHRTGNTFTQEDLEHIMKWYTAMGGANYTFSYGSFNYGPSPFQQTFYRRRQSPQIEISNRIAVVLLVLLFVYSLLR
ncbi:hypothetical protein NEIRO03_2309 [Nematocida sp. AWRm78]|nr:hypothetical protein NEIRO02_2026 [Nematocida sp. AWRm79]KAI5186509.1 hypothetical protein NEIRO03_2309 [Nematocida sp. AWRm78]